MERKKFKKGDVISSKTTRYSLKHQIESSKFGCQFEVSNDAGETFTLKVEWKSKDRPNPKLGMEIAILKHIRQSTVSTHYVDFIDHCQKPTFYFLVATATDSHLDQIMANLKKRFSPRTVFGVALQALEALQELHKLGYVHRDIRPASFCPGIGAKSGTIYLVNMGRASIFRKDGKVRKPREKAPIRGTPAFMSLPAHAHVEQSPRDDVESLLYTLVEMANGLPWRGKPEDTILAEKKKIRQDSTNFFRQLSPPNMKALVEYIDKLDYYTPVDYPYVTKKLIEAAKQEDCPEGTLNDDYDWELVPSVRGSSQSTSNSSKSDESPPISDNDTKQF